MNPKNAAELLAQPDIDGGLIGGASSSVSQVIDQVLGMLSGDTDKVISDLCGLLQTLA